MRGKHPLLGSGDEVGIPQLLGVEIFDSLQGFGDGSLTVFYGGCSGLGFVELHVELPSIDLNFFGSVDAFPQLGGLLVVLIIEREQVVGHVHLGGVVFLLLQGFHVGNLGWAVLL